MTFLARIGSFVPGMAPRAPRRNVLLALAYLLVALVVIGYVIG